MAAQQREGRAIDSCKDGTHLGQLPVGPATGEGLIHHHRPLRLQSRHHGAQRVRVQPCSCMVCWVGCAMVLVRLCRLESGVICLGLMPSPCHPCDTVALTRQSCNAPTRVWQGGSLSGWEEPPAVDPWHHRGFRPQFISQQQQHRCCAACRRTSSNIGGREAKASLTALFGTGAHSLPFSPQLSLTASL